MLLANVSSFYGYIYFRTKDKPWTPEGFLLSYDVLMSMDSSFGNYGFCMEEEHTVDSAAFMVALTAFGDEDPCMHIWGSGRWSAQNNFESFESWSVEPNNKQTISKKVYQTNRAKFLQLMFDNGWYFQFEYTDEECGSGFIVEEQVDITVGQDPIVINYLFFVPSICTVKECDYTLKNWSEMIEDERQSDLFNEVMETILRLLNIGSEAQKELFVKFIIEQDWDDCMSPYPDFEDGQELPEGLKEAWEVYQSGIKTENRII
jgi:hypothetical protein